MKCHQILTGACNPGDKTFAVGSVEGEVFAPKLSFHVGIILYSLRVAYPDYFVRIQIRLFTLMLDPDSVGYDAGVIFVPSVVVFVMSDKEVLMYLVGVDIQYLEGVSLPRRCSCTS
jgi:hypothetical protein